MCAPLVIAVKNFMSIGAAWFYLKHLEDLFETFFNSIQFYSMCSAMKALSLSHIKPHYRSPYESP